MFDLYSQAPAPLRVTTAHTVGFLLLAKVVCVKAAGWPGVVHVRVKVIKVFVQFLNHFTIYAGESSAAQAPQKGAAWASREGVAPPAGSSSGPTVPLGSRAGMDQLMLLEPLLEPPGFGVGELRALLPGLYLGSFHHENRKTPFLDAGSFSCARPPPPSAVEAEETAFCGLDAGDQLCSPHSSHVPLPESR